MFKVTVKFMGYVEVITYDNGKVEADLGVLEELKKLGDKVKDAKAFLMFCTKEFGGIIDIEGDYPLISHNDVKIKD